MFLSTSGYGIYFDIFRLKKYENKISYFTKKAITTNLTAIIDNRLTTLIETLLKSIFSCQ